MILTLQDYISEYACVCVRAHVRPLECMPIMSPFRASASKT